MPIDRKRMILGGLVLILGMSVRARTQTPAVQQPSAQAPTATGAAQDENQTAPPPRAMLRPSKLAAAPKKGKQPYTGPNAIIEQPATPMLDVEGRQRVDFDGKAMFNPPVKQQRDKSGHPLFDDQGHSVFQNATHLGFDEQGKKIRPKKEKVARKTPIAIAEGTFTVDGMVGKATLNYDIKDLRYIYLYAPWIGTALVSNRPFPGSKEQPRAFDQHTLTVTVEDHRFQLYSEKDLLGKKPVSAYVAVDRNFKLDSTVPAIGFGATNIPPYNWPDAKGNPETKAYMKPPPMPKALKQTRLLPACPEGMARTGPPAPGTVDRSCAVDAHKAVDPAPASENAPPVSTAPVPPPDRP